MRLPRVIVTGSRNFADHEGLAHALEQVLAQFGPFILVHGDCPTGADRMADEWAVDHQLLVHRFPADWAALGKAAGPTRNSQMVNSGAVLVVAFPHAHSPGTRDCVRKAKAAGINVWYPCGDPGGRA